MDDNLRVQEFSLAAQSELGPLEYARFCEIMDLPETEDGYGLLHCEDASGSHWTLLSDDADWVRLLKTVPTDSTDVLKDLRVPTGMFNRRRRGWPDEWGQV